MKCRICGEEKTQDDFYTYNNGTKRRSNCKSCYSKNQNNNYRLNRDAKIEYSKEWYKKNKKRRAEASALWAKNNPDKAKAIYLKFYYNHRDECNRQGNIRRKKRYKQDVAFRLNANMASRIHVHLSRDRFVNTWRGIIDYNSTELRQHLEQQFTPDMTWDNYGSYWHIDHIIPISVFNITSVNDYDFKRCWSLENLRPLSKIENIKKGNKLLSPFQPSLNMGVI